MHFKPAALLGVGCRIKCQTELGPRSHITTGPGDPHAYGHSAVCSCPAPQLSSCRGHTEPPKAFVSPSHFTVAGVGIQDWLFWRWLSLFLPPPSPADQTHGRSVRNEAAFICNLPPALSWVPFFTLRPNQA